MPTSLRLKLIRQPACTLVRTNHTYSSYCYSLSCKVKGLGNRQVNFSVEIVRNDHIAAPNNVECLRRVYIVLIGTPAKEVFWVISLTIA